MTQTLKGVPETLLTYAFTNKQYITPQPNEEATGDTPMATHKDGTIILYETNKFSNTFILEGPSVLELNILHETGHAYGAPHVKNPDSFMQLRAGESKGKWDNTTRRAFEKNHDKY